MPLGISKPFFHVIAIGITFFKSHKHCAKYNRTNLAQLWGQLAIGLALSSMIGFAARSRGSLSKSGALGAILTGTAVFGFGGWTPGLLLIAFFVSSSALSHFKQNNATKQHAAEIFEKGGQRDLGQTLANGGAASAFAVAMGLAALAGQNAIAHMALGGLVGALATVNADTWATELGVLSRARPRLITRLSRQVEPGTSGGVTVTGTLAALGGAAFIGLVFVVLSGGSAGQLVCAALGGLAGALADSWLGATVQGIYFDEMRNRETEKATDKNSAPNRFVRGWRWMNNDRVNFLSSLVGALVCAIFFR